MLESTVYDQIEVHPSIKNHLLNIIDEVEKIINHKNMFCSSRTGSEYYCKHILLADFLIQQITEL